MRQVERTAVALLMISGADLDLANLWTSPAGAGSRLTARRCRPAGTMCYSCPRLWRQGDALHSIAGLPLLVISKARLYLTRCMGKPCWCRFQAHHQALHDSTPNVPCPHSAHSLVLHVPGVLGDGADVPAGRQGAASCHGIDGD